MPTKNLMLFIITGNLAGVKTEIEKNGISVNAVKDEASKYSALHFATDMGHKNIVTYLLDHGANPNIQDVRGYTPLHLAIMQAKTAKNLQKYNIFRDIAKCLMAHGADPNIVSQRGTSPMDKAKEKPELDLLSIISGNTSESDKTAATVRSSKPHKKPRNTDKNTITCFANFFGWSESSATQEERKPFLQSGTGTKKFKME